MAVFLPAFAFLAVLRFGLEGEGAHFSIMSEERMSLKRWKFDSSVAVFDISVFEC